jgi:hypothetical protein
MVYGNNGEKYYIHEEYEETGPLFEKVLSQINQMVRQLPAITTPFRIEVNNSDHHHSPFGGSKNDTNLLPVAGISFQGIFRIGAAGGLAFAVVNAAVGQNFLHFSFINMAAVHSATGMFGINKLPRVAVNNLITGSTFIIGGAGWRSRRIVMALFMALLLLRAFLATCIFHTGNQHYQAENEDAGYYLLHNECKGRAS